MNKEEIKIKLLKIKALAERGNNGEKETAMRFYEEIKKEYNINDDEIVEEEVTCEWFRYKDNMEKRLLMQICYMITGCVEHWMKANKKYKLVGCECTKFEKKEIEFYFEYYKPYMEKELDVFMSAFCATNDLYPNENVRCYEEPKDNSIDHEKIIKVAAMTMGMERHNKPLKQIEGGDIQR